MPEPIPYSLTLESGHPIQQRAEKLPYTIAQSVKVLFTSELSKPSLDRLQRTMIAGETLTRFLAFIVLAECREVLEGVNAPAPPPAFRNIRNDLARPTFGSWLGVVLGGGSWLRQVGRASATADVARYLFNDDGSPTAANRALGALKSDRNDVAHHKRDLSTATKMQDVCAEVFDALCVAIEAAGFLDRSVLVLTKGIDATKKRRLAPVFRHSIAPLIGPVAGFGGQFASLGDPHDSNNVILKYEGGYLNLDPFYVFEECGGPADVFFFNGFGSAQNIEYVGCRVGWTFDSRAAACARADDLWSELTHLIGLFGGSRA
ncbi:MAG: hypothetical protein JWO56_1457 [Acidobacteria bacterium]|nr:hypothetical protein [Acidobacteriota bacterium]